MSAPISSAPRSVVTILGDGQMGLVMADALCTGGHEVRLWGPFPDAVAELAAGRTSARLPGFRLDPAIAVEPDAAIALRNAAFVVNAIPTQFIRGTWTRLRTSMPATARVICVAKGVEVDTFRTPLEIVDEVLGDGGGHCVLSGPTVAAELARHLPATMVAAARDPAVAEAVQALFVDVPWLRVYRHDDVVGTELAGATKNVIALAAGMIDGLGAGDNAKSALLARGLAEIARLGAARGARVDTFFGVAGVGDLATTCFSPSGRNRACGERIGRGEALGDVLASTAFVIEGVTTTRAVHRLAAQLDVEMPITAAVHAILFEGMAPRDAVHGLMSRAPKAERIG